MKTAARPFHEDLNNVWMVAATVAAFAAGIFAFWSFRGQKDAELAWVQARDDYKKTVEMQKKYAEISAQVERGAIINIDDEGMINTFLTNEMKKQGIVFKSINQQTSPPRNGWIQHSVQIDTDEKAGAVSRNNFALFLREVERVRPWLKSRDISIPEFDETGQVKRATVTFAYFTRDKK